MSTPPYDDDKIGQEDLIIRRINPLQHVYLDPDTNRNRITTKAYKKSTGLTEGMSVDIEVLIVADGVEPKIFVTTPIYTGSVAFPAGAVRALGLWVGYDPIKDDPEIPDNPYHGEVWTTTPKATFSEGQVKGLAKLARWYVELEDVDLI